MEVVDFKKYTLRMFLILPLVYNMNQNLRQSGQERHGAGIDQAAKHPPPPLDKKCGKKRGGVEKG